MVLCFRSSSRNHTEAARDEAEEEGYIQKDATDAIDFSDTEEEHVYLRHDKLLTARPKRKIAAKKKPKAMESHQLNMRVQELFKQEGSQSYTRYARNIMMRKLS